MAFARESLSGDMIARDRESHFDRDAWRRCADFGVLGMPIPQEYGGLGLGLTDLLAVMEGLGRGYARSGPALLAERAPVDQLDSDPALRHTPSSSQTYLPPLCDGTLIGANAASEPDAGSDIFSMRTRATRDGDFYVLNGTKTFVSNAPVADLFVAYATINPALGPMGITGFIVERDTPGLTVSRHLEKMGLRTSPMAEVIFDNCRVPVSQRLGREGRGVAVFECSMEWERGCILASCLGVMRAAARGVPRARPLAQAVRQADRQVPVGRQPAGRHEGAARHLPSARLPHRRTQGPGRRCHDRGRHRQALRLGVLREVVPRRGADLRRLRLHDRAAGRARPARRRRAARSIRAPPRSSGTSSPGAWVCERRGRPGRRNRWTDHATARCRCRRGCRHAPARAGGVVVYLYEHRETPDFSR